MKIIPGPFGHLEVEKVKHRPKGGLFLPYITNKSMPSCFVRVKTDGAYKGKVAVVHPGYVKEVDAPGLNTFIVKITDVRAWVEQEHDDEFYLLSELKETHNPDKDWTSL